MAIRNRGGRPLLAKIIMAVAAVGLFIVSYQWGNHYQRATSTPPTIGGVLIIPPEPLPDLLLRDANGEEFTRADLLERFSLLTIAPLNGAAGHRSVARMMEVYNRLGVDPDVQQQVRLLLVADAEVPALARDFERIAPALKVLTADARMLGSLRVALGETPDSTTFTAPSDTEDSLPPLYVIDPMARMAALLPSSEAPAEVAEDVAALTKWPPLREESLAPQETTHVQ